jgi:uncharacterized protein YceH (UPF0502 family)
MHPPAAVKMYNLGEFMVEKLNEVEVRVLGSLVEKQLTTPEYYPLTINALTAACNQKSNRDPVVSYDESTISQALDSLREKNLVYVFYGSTSRVVKYKHMLPSVYELGPDEVAVMAVLMLRGPQTIGELRERSGRMHEFGGLLEVQETLDRLAKRDDPLVMKLERQVGQKDARYVHLLAGEPDISVISAPRAAPVSSGNGRIEALESEVNALKAEVDSLRALFEEFRKQFE